MKYKVIRLLIMLLLLALSGCGVSRQETEEEQPSLSTQQTEPETEQTTAAIPVTPEITERWKNGDLSDLAGRLHVAPDDEEAAELQQIQDDFAAFDEETAPEDDGGILNLLSPFTKLELPEIMSGDSFPREVPLTITTPDLAKILTELHYEEYDSGEKLAEDLAAVLKKGGWPERTVTVNVTVQKDGETFHAGENPEAYFAFYGGLAELYMQEYTALLEQVGGMLGGEKE